MNIHEIVISSLNPTSDRRHCSLHNKPIHHSTDSLSFWSIGKCKSPKWRTIFWKNVLTTNSKFTLCFVLGKFESQRSKEPMRKIRQWFRFKMQPKYFVSKMAGWKSLFENDAQRDGLEREMFFVFSVEFFFSSLAFFVLVFARFNLMRWHKSQLRAHSTYHNHLH